MTQQYRIVHFSPQPWTGMRWPIAALVQSDSRVDIVHAPYLPKADCLGGPAAEALLRVVMGRLKAITDFAKLPPAIGQHVLLDSPRVIPLGVDDAMKWVLHALPRQEENNEKGESRKPSMAAYGQRLFATYHVYKYVRRKFDGFTHLGVDFKLKPITHWVQGASSNGELLLMEPIVISRQKLETEIVDIATKFAGYKYEIGQHGTKGFSSIQLVAYILPSESKQQKDSVASALRDKADQIIDTSIEQQRIRFINEIKRVGSEGITPLLH